MDAEGNTSGQLQKKEAMQRGTTTRADSGI
jgi:hypothetical protein